MSEDFVDVSEVAYEAGFACSVFVTNEVWDKCVVWTASDTSKQDYQEQDARLWDVLFVSAMRLKMDGLNPVTGLNYRIYCLLRDGESIDADYIQLNLNLCGNGKLLIRYVGLVKELKGDLRCR